ncbi:MAG TPA: GIY-YIG nuclease family protein [Pseudogracilibacillus sp.]|nr:GIY-YIG nuclease family protein [Pseudogracilibacillus sp.]
MENNKHFVYILKCKDETLYTGYTTNIKKRLKMHEKGKGAKYTRGRGPFKVVYTEKLGSKSAALQREFEIKKLCRKDKLRLIQAQKG